MEKKLEKCNCDNDKKCTCGDECTCGENCTCSDDCSCKDNMIIEMEDSNGDKVKVKLVGTFEDNGNDYALVDDMDNEENSYIFQIESTDEGDMLVRIDDEKEFERLCKVVDSLINNDNN